MESLHPLVVHFPIALLLTSLFIEALAWGLQKPHWHRVSLWNLALGTLGAVAAVLTGRLAKGVAKHSHEIYQIMNLHERLGYAVLVVTLGVVFIRLSRRDRLSSRFRWMAWVLLATACGLMVVSARLGGRLVYEFGVGGSYGKAAQGIVVR